MAKTTKSPFIPKTRKGQFYTCYIQFRESSKHGGSRSTVGVKYRLVNKTAFKTYNWEPCYFLCAQDLNKNGELYPSIVIPAERFASHFVPTNC